MPTLTLTLICTCADLPRSYDAHKRDFGHHTHHSPTRTQRPTPRREALSEDDVSADQVLGALCHARLRPAWLRCGPVSFPQAAMRHRGAEINAMITHAGVWHRRRQRASNPWLGAELTERQ